LLKLLSASSPIADSLYSMIFILKFIKSVLCEKHGVLVTSEELSVWKAIELAGPVDHLLLMRHKWVLANLSPRPLVTSEFLPLNYSIGRIGPSLRTPEPKGFQAPLCEIACFMRFSQSASSSNTSVTRA
jgi:hypothetical protein